MKALKIVDLGAARPTPLAPRIEDDHLAFVVSEPDGLVWVKQIRTGEFGNRFPLFLGVVDFQLSIWTDELERAALRDRIGATATTGEG